MTAYVSPDEQSQRWIEPDDVIDSREQRLVPAALVKLPEGVGANRVIRLKQK
jgi:hypothetical protein